MALNTPTPQQHQDESTVTPSEILQNLLPYGLVIIALLVIGPLVSAIGLRAVLLILLALPVYLVVKCNPRILKEEIIDQWDAMIGGGQGAGASLIQDTMQLVHEADIPDIHTKLQSTAPGLARGMFGVKRSFLVISNSQNPSLEQFRMYVSARDYGNCLQVSWYLLQQPNMWQKIQAVLICVPFLGLLVLPLYLIGRFAQGKHSGLIGLDVFDEQDLRAYVTTAHHSVLDAIEMLKEQHKIETPPIDRHSRGFLGIS